MAKFCYHCGLENPVHSSFSQEILGEYRSFCCAGCQAIAKTLVDGGLEDYYKYRTSSGNKPSELVPEEIQQIEALDSTEVIEQVASDSDDNHRTIQLSAEGISCAACGWLIRNQLNKMDTVHKVDVDVPSQTITLSWKKDKPLSGIINRLHALGYKAYPYSKDRRETGFIEQQKDYSKRLIVSGLGMMQVMMFSIGIYIGQFEDISLDHQLFLNIVSAVVALPIVTYAAWPFHRSAWINLRYRRLGMNFPVSIAISLAYLASIYALFSGQTHVYFDSVVMFTFFLLLGRFVEHRARFHATRKQQNFQQLLPLSASKINADGTVETVAINRLNTGDQIVVVAGGIIPVDCHLVSKEASIDESIMTGEFDPVSKHAGDELLSGSTNRSGGITLRVSKTLGDSHISQLIKMQADALICKPKNVALADKLAHYYVILLLIIALAVAIYWWHTDSQMLLPVLLSVLVVSCPCALSLATPAVFATATNKLASLGIVQRNPDALATLSKINVVYFDKTGTLTNGQMSIRNVIPGTLSEDDALYIASMLEAHSNHPMAAAFKKHRTKSSKTEHTMGVVIEKEHIGYGIEGRVNLNRINKIVRIGNEAFCRQINPQFMTQLNNDNKANIFLCSEDQLLASFLITDQICDEAKPLVNWLKDSNITVKIITGDHQYNAKLVADELEISSDNVFYNCKPEDKLTIIKNSTETTLMVGDGFNDVGALAAADVSLTLGQRSYLSQQSSDATLISQHLSIIRPWIETARKSQLIIKENYGWAILYNIIAIPFAAAGLIPAWLAAIGMTSSSLLVVLNATRLKR